jgi:hypothetical protein
MPYRLLVVLLAMLVCVSAPVSLIAQDAAPPADPNPSKDAWAWSHRVELRGNYRWSDDERVDRPVISELATVDPGHHVELNVADLQLDLGYGNFFAARAKVHAQALHRRNPTSNDRQVDVDELYIRIGQKPEFLERPDGTTFFAQAGKFPKMERQPVRLLESYGLAATSFNRFEDIQLLVGGTVGRSFYWRVQAANGNPLFIRDSNALAGDNGTPEELAMQTPKFAAGFPILYNAETEDYVFDTSHMQLGEALGYRWQNAVETLGFDLILFHYQRELADTVDLTGTAYGGDLDLLTIDEVPNFPVSLHPTGDEKREYGGRIFAEWHAATAIAQFTKQNVAGLQREGWEVEAGYRIPLSFWWIEAIQPALRVSGLENRFFGDPAFPAASVRWDWTKYDGGVRVTLAHGLDVTLEHTHHDIKERPELQQRETLVTVRWRS